MIMAGLGVLVVAVAGYWWFTSTRGGGEAEHTLRRTCMTDAQAGHDHRCSSRFRPSPCTTYHTLRRRSSRGWR